MKFFYLVEVREANPETFTAKAKTLNASSKGASLREATLQLEGNLKKAIGALITKKKRIRDDRDLINTLARNNAAPPPGIAWHMITIEAVDPNECAPLLYAVPGVEGIRFRSFESFYTQCDDDD